MHGHLKRRTARKPRASIPAQQRAFDAFQAEYNTVRPHAALDGRVPASLYQPSPTPYPKRLRPITYPEHFEVRRVSRKGGIRWFNNWVNVSHLIAGALIGLEEVHVDILATNFGPVTLGWLHVRQGSILDHDGHPSRNPQR